MKKLGGQTKLSAEEEAKLVKNIDTASKWGFPVTSRDLRIIVKSYLDSKGMQKFKNNYPGKNWVYSFLKRHNDILSQRWVENIKRARKSP